MINMHIPPLNKENIDKAISAIEAIDFEKIDVLQIEKLLAPLFVGLKMRAPVLRPPLDIYRGRICRKPFCLDDIRQPPSKMVQNMGRVNDVGEPVFLWCYN